MDIVKRIKGLILSPKDEWDVIAKERIGVVALYREYIVYLAVIPPFASFLSGYFFGYSHGAMAAVHLTLVGGLARATLQYLLSLPLLYLVAFVLSSIAPHFEGESDDARALALAAYSYTPAWLAALFGLAPGLRWLDILGFYGVYVFYFGLPRMLKCPKDNADVFTLAALILTIAVAGVHAWIMRLATPIF